MRDNSGPVVFRHDMSGYDLQRHDAIRYRMALHECENDHDKSNETQVYQPRRGIRIRGRDRIRTFGTSMALMGMYGFGID